MAGFPLPLRMRRSEGPRFGDRPPIGSLQGRFEEKRAKITSVVGDYRVKDNSLECCKVYGHTGQGR